MDVAPVIGPKVKAAAFESGSLQAAWPFSLFVSVQGTITEELRSRSGEKRLAE
jgi:hypothetical protein